MSWPLLRSQVVRASIGSDEPKLFVVVSNNRRNEHLPQVLTVRLTTSAKPAIPSIVELGHPEIFVGRAVCDDIVEIYQDEVIGVVGALSIQAMSGINKGLAAALGMSD
ncbi:mRNA interferase MazF [Kribbella amoyensis]|uniref:mRNA interferase MazF n=1 Tax=Kribbella amoyensis TaxID=996641 RepID=A0A561B3P5_9ACTN|nr:type II toxin-antitoxin system PemK/MazF family toxin [Kribbella amoyensis]TWD73467.1 mRNA interferase MazF [Kribbella amoyensis]